jgi:hypothetical protein
VTGAIRSDTFVIKDIVPTYTIEVDNAVAGEGDTVVFSIDGTNIPPTTLYFEILHGTTTDADFTSTPPQTGSRQSVSVSNIGDTLYTATFANNGDDADESFTARIYDAATGGTLLASLPFAIKGNTVSNVITRDVSSVDEGDSFTFTFTTNRSDGVYYYWIGNSGIASYASSTDFTNITYASFNNRKAFVVEAGVGTFVISTTADGQTELDNDETFDVLVSATINGVAIAALGGNTIINTSKASYALQTGVSVTEGSDLTMELNITTQNVAVSETLYYEVTGADVLSRFPITQKSAPTPTDRTIPLFATTSTTTYEGPKTGTMTVRSGSHTGTVLDSTTFTLIDQPVSMIIAPNSTAVDEDSTVIFSVTGTNIPDGTYYWRETTYVKVAQTSTSTPAGVSIIYLNSTADLTIGMKTDSLGIPGTISFVGSSYITMTSPTTLSINTGTILHWALPGYFDDADNMHGSFSITSNAGVWEIYFPENNDTADDLFTFGVFSGENDQSELANSGAIAINDITPTATVITSESSPFNVSNFGSETDARAGIKIWSDGRITSSTITNTIVTARNRGNWVNDVALLTDPSNYELFVTVNNTIATGTSPPSGFIGEEDTWLNLGSDREFATYVFKAPGLFQAEIFLYSTFTIREISNPSNTYSFNVDFVVTVLSLGLVGGEGQVL